MRKTGCMKAARCFLSSKWKGKVNPMESSNQFLGTERIGKLMQKYAIPCIISLLVGALYNIVDQIFIANASYLGSYGNAANTVVFPLTVVALAIAVMIGDGCCAFVSISLGQNEVPKAKRSVGNAVVMCLVSSIVLAALYLIFADTILAMFGGTVNAETYHHSQEYFFYITLGVPFYMFGQAMNPIIRADGNPRFAMVSTLAGAALNIILDPIFIFGFRWGMMGAAVATVIGQLVTAALAVWYLLHMKITRPEKGDYRLKGSICGRTLTLGMTSFLSQISLVAAMAAINNMIRKYGALDAVFGQEQYAQIPMAVVGIVISLALRSVNKGRLSKSPIILNDEESAAEGYVATRDMEVFLGKEGVTTTVLRPAGMAEFDGVKLNVVADGEYIPKDARVRVDHVEGARVVVRKLRTAEE